MPEDSKDMVAYIPLPKWRKEKHSSQGMQATIRLRESRLCCRAGEEHLQHACARTVFLVYTQTPMDEESPGSCGCAVTLTSSPGRLRNTSGPAPLSPYAGAQQKGQGFGASDECQRGCALGGTLSLRLRRSPAAGCHCGCARRAAIPGRLRGWLCGRSR